MGTRFQCEAHRGSLLNDPFIGRVVPPRAASGVGGSRTSPERARSASLRGQLETMPRSTHACRALNSCLSTFGANSPGWGAVAAGREVADRGAGGEVLRLPVVVLQESPVPGALIVLLRCPALFAESRKPLPPAESPTLFLFRLTRKPPPRLMALRYLIAMTSPRLFALPLLMFDTRLWPYWFVLTSTGLNPWPFQSQR